MVEAIRRVGCTTITHHVQSADTTIENPTIANFLHSVLDELQLYIEASALPVQVHVTTPSLASQFVVSTIGRGTLVRTPENGVRDGRRTRACADEWKVRPGGRLRTLLERRATGDGAREVITVLGLRRDESTSRAVAMTERRDSAEVAVRSRTGALTLSPLSEWTSDDVWTMLALLADAESLRFPSPLMPRTIHRLSEIYRAGNGGTCGVVVGDSGARAACGSRFGCSFCLVAGERDKSLEAMIEDEQYGHLRPLNDFRNYLLAIQWDMARRELVGRSLSDAGYTRIQADTYSYLTRVGLLKMLCSIDAAERDRAEAHSGAQAIGLIPDTEENRLLCEPQFEFVTPQQLVAIDFFLSMHHYAPHAFPALAVWHDVRRPTSCCTAGIQLGSTTETRRQSGCVRSMPSSGIHTGIPVGPADTRGPQAVSRRSISRKPRSSRWTRKRRACSSPARTTPSSCWTLSIATRSTQRIFG
ncbi:phosphoadenosine phosphosulfate reductase domain-containing protein [Caballeronia cordobensis]|uniref:phosphoadenosine phosphosulfate reductase domain-containing protein n=1 Tax=Caballeronia cordobensis TaxID=1353886 RepID=UPI001F2890B8|nr:phosphoadenosine phosphosulfate reductase family protein [Caballeronia cordobensis]